MSDADVEGFQERWVAYLDVLGFGERVKKAAASSKERLLLEKIQETLANKNIQNDRADLRVTQFSDSMVVSGLRHSQALFTICLICRLMVGTMLRHGLLMRGGIAGGGFVHNDNTMFGEPLVATKEFDRSGEFPHIALREDVVDELSKPENHALEKWLTFDPWDGSPMLHTMTEFENYTIHPHPGPITAIGEEFRDRITENLTASKKPDHQRKWRWMREYWNRSVKDNELFKQHLVP